MNAFSPAILLLFAIAADEAPDISPAKTDDSGFLVHEINSSFQDDKTQVKILLPASATPDRKCPAIYLLPVEAANESRYGSALTEVKQLGLHDKHNAIFIAPTFSHLPWYADHPTEPTIRQESYFLKTIVPFVEKCYPVQANPKGRLLLGFSKSGWGVWSLLLRHPDVFRRAAAWDAPLTMDRLGKYGTEPIFGTPKNFDNYRITDLFRTKGKSLGPEKRLILMGYGNFREDHEQAHRLLDELTIPHVYRDGPSRKHNWHSGWLPEAVELLLAGESGK